MRKKTKSVKKQKYPIAEMAAKHLQDELAPIFWACNELSKKYAALSASAEKNVKRINRSLSKLKDNKSPEAKRLVDQEIAWEYASNHFSNLADDLRYVPQKGRRCALVPDLSMAADTDAFDLSFLDTLAGLEDPQDLTPVAKAMRKVADALQKTGKPTGGAALSAAEKSGSTKTVRKGTTR